MVTNPDAAFDNVTTFEELGRLLTELMEPWYKDGNEKGWKEWAHKFNNFDKAVSGARKMYHKKVGE